MSLLSLGKDSIKALVYTTGFRDRLAIIDQCLEQVANPIVGNIDEYHQPSDWFCDQLYYIDKNLGIAYDDVVNSSHDGHDWSDKYYHFCHILDKL